MLWKIPYHGDRHGYFPDTTQFMTQGCSGSSIDQHHEDTSATHAPVLHHFRLRRDYRRRRGGARRGSPCDRLLRPLPHGRRVSAAAPGRGWSRRAAASPATRVPQRHGARGDLPRRGGPVLHRLPQLPRPAGVEGRRRHLPARLRFDDRREPLRVLPPPRRAPGGAVAGSPRRRGAVPRARVRIRVADPVAGMPAVPFAVRRRSGRPALRRRGAAALRGACEPSVRRGAHARPRHRRVQRPSRSRPADPAVRRPHRVPGLPRSRERRAGRARPLRRA